MQGDVGQCPLCATSGAGRVCAQLWRSAVAVHRPAGQTSTEASGRIYYIFYVNAHFDPEVDSRRGNLVIISTSSIWQLRQLQRILEEFLVFLYVKVGSFLEVDFWACPVRGSHKEINGHYSYELSDDV